MSRLGERKMRGPTGSPDRKVAQKDKVPPSERKGLSVFAAKWNYHLFSDTFRCQEPLKEGYRRTIETRDVGGAWAFGGGSV